jgi:hypothetical protein
MGKVYGTKKTRSRKKLSQRQGDKGVFWRKRDETGLEFIDKRLSDSGRN